VSEQRKPDGIHRDVPVHDDSDLGDVVDVTCAHCQKRPATLLGLCDPCMGRGLANVEKARLIIEGHR
jgi:hypothetical protein